MELNLKGKTAIVTGGARGIGKEIVSSLLEEGVEVAVFDVEKTEDVFSLRVNVANFGEVEEGVRRVIDKFEKVTILINNAGITRDALFFRMREEDWDRVLEINLKGAFNCSRAVLPYMLRERWGRIINLSSVIGLRGNIGQANYAASKAGLIGLTKSLAREVAKRGITVNAICPGFIDTPMTQKLPEKVREEMVGRIPLGRIGLPKEVADLVLFLCSERASYITGTIIRIDGGMAI